MFEIDESLSFDFRDEYQRKPIADKAIQLLQSDIDISPMLIDGAWGTGKTEFTHKLINLYRQYHGEARILYLDAYQADSHSDPLLVVLAAIAQVLPEKEKASLIKQALPALRFTLKTGLKAGVSWLLKQDATDIANDFESDLKKAGDEVINNAIELALKDQINADTHMQTLKTALQSLTEISPLVLFVDELDRCRPDFALNMLEVIKHVFDIPGLNIVLVTNLRQLKSSIHHSYGLGENANRYLDKFIKFQLTLPVLTEPRAHHQTLNALTHFTQLIASDQALSQSRKLNSTSLIHFIAYLFRFKQVSLRESEALFRLLKIFNTLDGQDTLFDKWGGGFAWTALHFYGLYLHYFYPEIAEALITDTVTLADICATLGKSEIIQGTNERTHRDIEDYIVAIFSFREQGIRADYQIEPKELIGWWQVQFSHAFSSQDHKGFIDGIRYAINVVRLS